MNIFDRCAPFIQEYIYRNRWENLWAIYTRTRRKVRAFLAARILPMPRTRCRRKPPGEQFVEFEL